MGHSFFRVNFTKLLITLGMISWKIGPCNWDTPITNAQAAFRYPLVWNLASKILEIGYTHSAGSNLSLYFLKILSKHKIAFFLTNREYFPSWNAMKIISLCNYMTSSSGAKEPIIVRAKEQFTSFLDCRSLKIDYTTVLYNSEFCSVHKRPW
jgi:hypothetical protein